MSKAAANAGRCAREVRPPAAVRGAAHCAYVPRRGSGAAARVTCSLDAALTPHRCPHPQQRRALDWTQPKLPPPPNPRFSSVAPVVDRRARAALAPPAPPHFQTRAAQSPS
jgi:hypothetical protein